MIYLDLFLSGIGCLGVWISLVLYKRYGDKMTPLFVFPFGIGLTSGGIGLGLLALEIFK